MTTQQKLGIIQSRGLGDIIIALPIARWYADRGHSIYWPVDQQWAEQLDAAASWVNWIPLPVDARGSYFYQTPWQLLTELGCDEILPLYQALTGHPEFSQEPWFQHTSFDQYKYIRAGVPFLEKWQLARAIQRDSAREQALYDQIVGTDCSPYVVTHLASSQQTVSFDPAIIPEGWRVINITQQGWLFDWLTIIESAEAVIMTDSSMANLVDQLQIAVDRYFIPQHHIGLTPVQGQHWHWLPNPNLNPAAQIFRAA